MKNLTSLKIEKSLPWHHAEKINTILHKQSVKEENNIIHTFRAEFDDEMMLGVKYCEPLNPITQSPVMITPALSTGLHGRNVNIQRKLAEIGLPSVLIGVPGEERDSFNHEVRDFFKHPTETLKKLGSISLSKNAHYVQEIIKQNSIFNLDDKKVFGYGESRGAMILLGNIAAQKKDNIEIPFSIAVAPCYPEAFKVTEILQFTEHALSEIVKIPRLLGSLSINNMNTLNISPKSLIYEVAHIPTLLNGDTGNFISEIPKTQNIDLISFDDDLSGQANFWKMAFPKRQFPNINTEIIPGNHLSLASNETLDLILNKFTLIANKILNKE